MKPRLSITLADKSSGMPLDVLFDCAVRALTLDGRVCPKWKQTLAKIALRAVCEAILRDNCATFPLEVEIKSGCKMEEPPHFERLRRSASNVIPVKFGEDSAA